MIRVGVNAAVRDQPDEVKALARGGGNGFPKNFILSKGAVADGEINAGQLLVDDTTSTKVETTDFRISHLPLGETDLEAAGLKPAPRVLLVKAVVNRGSGEKGGIALLFRSRTARWIDAPPVSD